MQATNNTISEYSQNKFPAKNHHSLPTDGQYTTTTDGYAFLRGIVTSTTNRIWIIDDTNSLCVTASGTTLKGTVATYLPVAQGHKIRCDCVGVDTILFCLYPVK